MGESIKGTIIYADITFTQHTVVTDLNLIWPNSEKVKKIISILANTQQECSDDSYTFS